MEKYSEYIDPDMVRFLNQYNLNNMSECDFFRLCEEIDLENRGEDGNLYICYPRITEQKASRQYTCNISSGIIRVGSPYYRYTLFMENLTKKRKLVLQKPIILESPYYIDYLPTNRFEIDQFNNQITLAQDGIDTSSDFDLTEFASSYGYLMFQEIGKTKRKILK